MSNTVIRPIGYTGSVQQLEWQYGNGAQVTAYIWGGGGGGGGNDSHPGGSGGGGGYATSTFTINNGDVIKVAVGGQGITGRSGTQGGGGAPGASWVPDQLFNTRTAIGSVPVIPYSNPSYCSFLNTYGVWVNPVSSATFDNTYTINFPTSGYYTVTASCDNYGYVSIDGETVLTVPDFHYSVQTSVYVTSGNHTVRLYGVNTGGPGSFGATIIGGDGYSGGAGSGAGGGGSSGAGGGGGGATVIFLNDVVNAVAAGGGGGGGGGNGGAANGQSAPGTRGQAALSTAGQTGQPKGGDGGGAGGGGGGSQGGNGGAVPGGDQGGYAGTFGISTGTANENPNGRIPGGSGSAYYSSGVARGGVNTQSGTTGYAVFVFDIPGVFVNQGGTYAPASKVWVNDNSIWKPAQSIWVKDSGTWKQVLGGMPPLFTSISGNFGVNSRPFG